MLGLGVARGMLTTLYHFFFVSPVTVQYPEHRVELPPWTRGRPRLIYDVDSGDLRCTACGACALACPVDVIKIEQHPSPVKGKILDRFDLDMGGCIECALCVEACPFRAIVMAPDFEFGTYNRQRDLVFNMHELRIAGTPEVDGAMEFIQGVKRGRAGQEARTGGPAAAPAVRTPSARATGPGSTRASGPGSAGVPAASTPAASAPDRPAAPPPGSAGVPPAAGRRPAAVGATEPSGTPASRVEAGGTPAVPGGGGPLDKTDDMAGLSASERAKIYKERAAAAGIGRPAPPEA